MNCTILANLQAYSTIMSLQDRMSEGIDYGRGTFFIQDWTGKTCFHGKTFTTFADAWEFIREQHPDDETAWGEYYVIPCREHTIGCRDCPVTRKEALLASLDAGERDALHPLADLLTDDGDPLAVGVLWLIENRLWPIPAGTDNGWSWFHVDTSSDIPKESRLPKDVRVVRIIGLQMTTDKPPYTASRMLMFAATAYVDVSFGSFVCVDNEFIPIGESKRSPEGFVADEEPLGPGGERMR